jgi:hypothetical protein
LRFRRFLVGRLLHDKSETIIFEDLTQSFKNSAGNLPFNHHSNPRILK